MDSRPVPGGGLATWSVKRPNSVYVASPDANRLIEVYDPDAERAREFRRLGRRRTGPLNAESASVAAGAV